jgi:Arc/MetJ family transcription regulator
MRVSVVLDDELMQTALELSGYETKKKAIEEGLRLLIRVSPQKRIGAFRGKLHWTGNLDEVRTDK